MINYILFDESFTNQNISNLMDNIDKVLFLGHNLEFHISSEGGNKNLGNMLYLFICTFHQYTLTPTYSYTFFISLCFNIDPCFNLWLCLL